MKTWVSIVTVFFVWILSCLLNIPPYFGLGQYVFLHSIGTCGSLWYGQSGHLVYFCLFSSAVVVIIVVATLWTFFISKKIIQGIVFLHHSISEKSITIHKHAYMHRIKKLVGIFGTLLIVTSLTYLPGILAAMIAVFWNILPIPAFSTVWLFCFFLTLS